MGRFRSFVIKISELLAFIMIVLVTIGSAYAGYKFIQMIPGQADKALIGLFLGACVGFLLSALPAAAIFTLSEIAHSTQQSFLLLEQNLTVPSEAQDARQPVAHRTFRVRPIEPTNRHV
jgi:hypothetical protein